MSVRPGGARGRAGIVLPFVLVAMVLVALLAADAQFIAWRASRAARQAWNGARSLLAADEGIARTVASWDAAAFAAQAIGARVHAQITTADGEAVDVTVTRTQPLIAFVESRAQSRRSGAASAATRRVGRALFVQPPSLPLRAAVTAIGPFSVLGSALISGQDTAPADECGPWRDTLSVGGVESQGGVISHSATILGSPTVATGIDPTADALRFDRAWSVIASRTRAGAFAVAGGLVPVYPPWHAVMVRDTAPVQVHGVAQHEGLLAIDQDLVVHGTLRVRGVLLVRGAVHATHGQLLVEGAVVVRSPHGHASDVGSAVRIRYSQCALRRALAAVALPSRAPFHLWSER